MRISPLRQRMIEDMNCPSFSKKGAEGLHPVCEDLHRLSRTIAGDGGY